MKSASAQIADQLAHAAFTGAVLLGPAIAPGPITFAFAGALIIFLREYTEEEVACKKSNIYISFSWRKVFSLRSILDMLGGAFGGLLIGLIFT